MSRGGVENTDRSGRGEPFGVVLRRMVRLSGVPQQDLARAVQYDGSYLSKWMNGSMLPSPKSAQRIFLQLAECMTAETQEEQLEEMLRVYDCRDAGALKSKLRDRLSDAWQEERRGRQARSGEVSLPGDEDRGVRVMMPAQQFIRLQEEAFRRGCAEGLEQSLK